jgi:hypothetical protein
MINKLGRFIGSFIIGMIVGAAIFLVMYGHSYQDLLLENRKLESNMEELHIQLESAMMKEEELNWRKQQKILVKKIEIEVVKKKEGNIDDFVETEIIDRLRGDLKFLIGMPLENISEAHTHTAIIHLISGRKYEINQQEFGLKLESLVIYSTLKIRVHVDKVK